MGVVPPPTSKSSAAVHSLTTTPGSGDVGGKGGTAESNWLKVSVAVRSPVTRRLQADRLGTSTANRDSRNLS
jgi:hypothetical protein